MLPRSVTRHDQEGPQQSWRPPQLSRFRSCFKERLAAEAYSTRFPHRENKAYTEILTFNFIQAAPVDNDTTTDAGIAWWKYRAALISRTGCGGMRRITYIDQSNKVDLALGMFCLLPSSGKNYMLIASCSCNLYRMGPSQQRHCSPCGIRRHSMFKRSNALPLADSSIVSTLWCRFRFAARQYSMGGSRRFQPSLFRDGHRPTSVRVLHS